MFTSIPSSKNNIASYRRKISSKDFNDREEKIAFDILDLYNKLNVFNNNLQDITTMLEYENKFLRIKLDNMENELSTKYNSEKDFKKISVFPSQMKSVNQYPVEINNITYDLSQNIVKRISKVNIHDELTDNIIIPSNLDISYKYLYTTNSYLNFESNDIENALDGKPYTAWIIL